MKNPVNPTLDRRGFLKTAAFVGAGASVLASPLGRKLSNPAYAQSGKSITIAIPADPPSLDPHSIEQDTPQQVTWNIYETLLSRDKAGKIIPWLAESYEQVSPTKARLKIRSGVVFHNGEPFNADAAVFSINRINDPTLNSQWVGTVNTIKGAVKIDDATVEVETTKPDPILQGRLTVIAMMAPGWTKEASSNVGIQANGTGAYIFHKWQRNISIELSANPSYWGGEPSIKSAIFRIIPEDATRFQSIKTGEIDLYLGLLPDQAAELEKYAAGLAQSFSFIRLSIMEGSRIKDPRIRQAMNYAIDKETIFNQLEKGLGSLLKGQVSGPEMFGFNPDLSPYPYDPQMAKSLIQQAGAHDLEISFVGPKGRYGGDAVEQQAIADMLEQSGLKINLTLIQPNAWDRAGDRNQTPVAPDCWYCRHDNSLFDADRTLSSYYTDQGSWSAYNNPDARSVFEKSRVELDTDKRKALLGEVFKIGHEDPMGIFLFQHVNLWGTTARTVFEPRVDSRLLIQSISLAS